MRASVLGSVSSVEYTPHMRTMAERFVEKVNDYDDNGCLTWSRSQTYDGYGRFRVGPLTRGAHVVAYELYRGPVPPGMQVDHICFVRHCVNPAHLEAVTPKENNRRKAVRVTHCPQGHEYTESNTRKTPAGYRYCLECKRLKVRAYRADRRTS